MSAGWCWLLAGTSSGAVAGAPGSALSMWQLGFLTAWWQGSKVGDGGNLKREESQMEAISFSTVASKVTQCHFCCILSIRCELVRQDHFWGEGGTSENLKTCFQTTIQPKTFFFPTTWKIGVVFHNFKHPLRKTCFTLCLLYKMHIMNIFYAFLISILVLATEAPTHIL